jgi:hypothetical protein
VPSASGSLQFWASGFPSSLIGRLAAWKACSQGCAVKMIAAILPRRCRKAKSIRTSSSLAQRRPLRIAATACVVGNEYTPLRKGKTCSRSLHQRCGGFLSLSRRRPPQPNGQPRQKARPYRSKTNLLIPLRLNNLNRQIRPSAGQPLSSRTSP